MKPSNIADLAWAAGFIEGEGSFSLSKGPAIQVTQKQREPLSRLVEILGGKVYEVQGGKYGMWTLYGKDAVGAMFTIFTWMSPRRREQMKKIIARWKMMPGRAAHLHPCDETV